MEQGVTVLTLTEKMNEIIRVVDILFKRLELVEKNAHDEAIRARSVGSMESLGGIESLSLAVDDGPLYPKKEKAGILEWERATNNLVAMFIELYFDEDTDFYWIADEIGGVLNVNDYFFNLDTITDALRYDATSDALFRYYDLDLDASMKGEKVGVNFKNYIKGMRPKK